MSYITGGNIQATDYNTFATSAQSVNEVFADLHSNETTVAAGADFGYGQTPALTSVAIGQPVTAAQWTALFTAMKNCGVHQGTPVVPPLPGTPPATVTMPAIGDIVASYNTNVSPAAINTLISTLRANKFNLAAGQTSVIPGTLFSNPSAWTTSLTYRFQVDFGSWNNARYYFNTGGKISITGAYINPTTAEELEWQTLLSTKFPVNINWQTTTGASGNNIANAPGFYIDALTPSGGLTTTYKTIFERSLGGAYYTGNYGRVNAKLANAAGTDGKIDFEIVLVNGDTLPETKPAGKVTFTINRIQTSSPIVYAGAFTYTSVGFVST